MKFVRAIVLSAVVIGGSSLLLLALIAFLVTKAGSLPLTTLPLITTVAACIPVFLGGLISALAAREKGIYLGLAAGALMAVAIGLAAYFTGCEVLTAAGIGKAAALLVSGAIGGILGANRKQKVKF